ncbi:hypothetical protein ADUPG1_006409, partial [Aduncisulcus paluster]
PVSDDLGLCSGSSRGTCDAATHTCVCESGYYGSACNLYCDNLSRCGLHGQCAVGDLSSDSSETSSSETLYCECDAGWYGSTCSSQYPVETVEYVNDDDETNPTIVDYVCGVNYSTNPSSSYSADGIYSSDTDTYSCDCSSYGLITDASTSTCIDPATHPEYKDIAGNDTACLTCGTTTDSHGICVLGEGEDSLTAMCQCEYGWGNFDDSTSISCSYDMCGVTADSYSESSEDPSSLCSSHGMCNSYTYADSNALNIQYGCMCDIGWNGMMCDEEDNNSLKIFVWISVIVLLISIGFSILGFTFWFRLRKKNLTTVNAWSPSNSSLVIPSDFAESTPTVVQVRDDPSLHESLSTTLETSSYVTVKRRKKVSDSKEEKEKKKVEIKSKKKKKKEKKPKKSKKRKRELDHQEQNEFEGEDDGKEVELEMSKKEDITKSKKEKLKKKRKGKSKPKHKLKPIDSPHE